MSKQMKVFLYVVMAAALTLMIICFLNYQSLTNDLRSCEKLLAESRETWEEIAAEKEELQTDLKARRKELKEAQLSLDESTERIEQLKAEIEQLRKDIDILRQNRD